MSIGRVGAGPPSPFQPERVDGGQRQVERGGARTGRVAVRDDAPASAEAVREAGAAPEGVDPALWSVLTTEERGFFARARELGPLTYGPGTKRSGAASPPVGGRVDIRV